MVINLGQGLLNALMYMGPLLIIGGLVSLYLWERTSRTKIKTILVKTAGGTATYFVNKEGDEVTLANPATGWSGTWPINSLATIPQPYPDLSGLLPRFLQREIQTAIFIEGDIEPLLNRSAHRPNVASPNVVAVLREVKALLIEAGEDTTHIDSVLDNLVTGPTRELIASPEWVASLRKSTALKALASVSDDLVEALKRIHNQLARFAGLNSTYVYLGLVFTLVLLGVNLFYTIQMSNVPGMADVSAKLDAIQQSLGIVK